MEGLYLIAFGTAEARLAFFGEDVPVRTKDRLEALQMLRDSGPGKPTQAHEIELPPDVPLFNIPGGFRVDMTTEAPQITTTDC